jgi:hypothetical protein
MRSVIARWVEAETVRRKLMGFSFQAIADQITALGRGQTPPLIPFPDGIEFPVGYRITYRGAAKAFSLAFARVPTLEVEQMRRLDTERIEDIYRGLVPGIMRGEPASCSAAVRSLEHKARINGYAVEPEQVSSSSSFQINIHLDGKDRE